MMAVKRLLLILYLLSATTAEAVAQGPATDALDRARELFRQHRYFEAQAAVDSVLHKHPANADALSERGRLLIQAWRLDAADSIARSLGDVRGTLLHGRVQLRRKNYDAALHAARAAQQLDPRNAAAFLLEADVHFWRERPELAEAPLQRALELDPDDPDARFAYGYAIWRHVDARQLPAMAEQWNRALASDPLHYLTHWHFGNGHTHLTYADYAQPTDSIVRVRMRDVDSLVAAEKIVEAIALTGMLESEFPESLLPTLMRGSIYYLAYNLPRAERLDSAQATFLSLLARKQNYGPAHNGLAAVIKQRQFAYVANYDSLEAAIAAEALPADSAFTRVFKDLSYYPGDRAERMARQQLGPALAYVPFLARLGYTYTVEPLHHDLAYALDRPFFRTATTFDNRQWMDIRGAGGNHAAAGIEYVERGSHQERVVLLHEYVHQWHGAVLTDQEVRRIRQLYYDAMAGNRTLDYYAANNESEFFAQSYEAYLTPVKVHPLNHKSMNTTADLIAKDPVLYAFLDSLITKNRAYLAGNHEAMRSNWAQVYVSLARRERGRAVRTTDPNAWSYVEALVDTALSHDARYVPALLELAATFQEQKKWQQAEAVLARASAVDSTFAPTFAARAALIGARARAERIQPDVDAQILLYQHALALETDLEERADLNRTLRELYYDAARIPDALATADEYARTAPTPSTYLRDARDEAAAFAASVRSEIGYADSVAGFFHELVGRKPQNYQLRARAARALARSGQHDEAARLVSEGLRILGAGRQRRVDYLVILAGVLASAGQGDSARAIIRGITVEERDRLGEQDRIALIRTQLALSDEQAPVLVPADSMALPLRVRADRLHALALAQPAGERDHATRLLRRVLELNPYHMDARLALVALLHQQRKASAARRVADAARALPIELGPAYWTAVSHATTR